MLLTFLYMIATIMQARRISLLKAHLKAIFKGDKTHPSIVLRIKIPQHLKDFDTGYTDKRFLAISSHLCINKHLAKIDDLVWYQEDAILYTIYPQQKVFVFDWLSCPDRKFPLYTNNCYQISSKSDLKMHILVDLDIETYTPWASTISAKIEDYGLIVAWTSTFSSISFILETDIEHVTSLITGLLQGQYRVNYGLCVSRVQTVLIEGKPYIYDDTRCLEPPSDMRLFQAMCEETQLTSSKCKFAKFVKVRGMSVRLPDVDPSEMDEKNVKSNSAPATCSSSPTKHVKFIKYPQSLKTIPRDDMGDDTFGGYNKHDSPKMYLPDVTKKEDNSSEESKNTDQSKSIRQTTSKNSELELKEKPSKVVKPPNILVCADTRGATDNLQNLLSKVLAPDRYDIRVFYKEDYDDTCKVWIDQVSLVVLSGNVRAELGAQLVEYIIHGGKLLALCSDMLHILLPTFQTAEVRENELVQFSYGKWKQVRMMHHIFCYHASPVRTRFSQDQEDTRTPPLNPPTSTSVKDKRGNLHSFDVKVLGKEETWHSPSILLATLPSSGGKVVFSQIHLEVDPTQYEYEGDKFNELKKSNVARLEIISDLLSTHLGLEINRDTSRVSDKASVQYTPGYFLGKFEMKMKMFEKLKDKMNEKNTLTVSTDMQIQFCANNENVCSPSANLLPIMMHMCPPNFSTVDYFENLSTKELGRLVIYTDVLTSSMNVINNTQLEHGLTVIPRQQTSGRGRYNNNWLSPIGCAMFTLQVHIPVKSNLGPYISLLQHIAAVALVSAVRSIKGYEDIDLRIKWPNDIYIGNSIKIAGIIVSTRLQEAIIIGNIGAGVNLSNSKPTSCINDVILQYNQKHGTKLKTLSHEKYLALVFNEMETLLDILQNGNTEHFYQLYYKYWLHTNANVTVTWTNGRRENVTIIGIDEYGYLLVKGKKEKLFSVHSDGNSFDLFNGLIVPK
ncbi:PREDICTED: biotin--protein ligase isoform X3 [Wasmannia auropunctata]|uniref:biotin--protein ligase isoform X3 n=1 Tax=Wasmannia auropunctata TaxID=64793 RepID=UPI0005EE56D7|nr:PREDICTED: biotin--protein ligase isoform X3 [Wasmannia auropunctata]XP_011695671.1 PREDICTED: biotin--protein ligase isoform X3 [Wasmannia auropunctata]XP_011695672.1 PREDICTED: biotin--protein ligase isoform X3 [Wasmannia auropunctata]XP_011695674.1 PREDICTED: biotin--protein ligase isoform X3 [Wasmannia auropunctata]XP_011695675.1 PREDICTED: biotin--protein ligase isoform X3 [Wasmannia auropunctata]XP_011695676.1 PREDICTED: biotin--protein ligase isoform X3 [Wasmannia auropunctata]XP_01